MLVHQRLHGGILYLVILNRADFSTQVLSVVLPHFPEGPESKVKAHTEPCRLVFIPFGRISTFPRLSAVDAIFLPFRPPWPRFLSDGLLLSWFRGASASIRRERRLALSRPFKLSS